MVNSETRVRWMDRVRGLAIVLIIVWHAVSIPTFFGFPVPTPMMALNDALSPYRIPALLLLSGMLLDRSLNKPLARYYAGKFASILWPLLVWNLIQVLTNPSLDGGSLSYWIGGDSYLWYLMVVGACYILGPVVRWVPAFVVAAALIIVGAAWETADVTTAALLDNSPYFFIGAAIWPFIGKILRSPGWIVAIGGGGAIAWGLYTAVATGYANRLDVIGTPMSVIGVLCAAWLFSRSPRLRVLEWVGERSLVFYAAHFPVMIVVCLLGAVNLPILSLYAVLFLAGVGVAAVLARFLGDSLLFSFPVPGSRSWSRLSRLLSRTPRSR